MSDCAIDRIIVKKNLNLRRLCSEILGLDPKIKMAVMATTEKGGSILAARRRGENNNNRIVVEPQFTREEIDLSVMQSLIRMNMRATLEPKLGRTLYSFTEYEREARATIKVANPEEIGLPECSVLIVAFDKAKEEAREDKIDDDNAYSIMSNKILPFLESLGEGTNDDYTIENEEKRHRINNRPE